jgi:spore germination protein (amino acid permease)
MDRFSSKHFVFLMMGSGIISIKMYPIVFIKNCGRDSWVAVIIASALAAFYFYFAVSTMKKGCPTLGQIYRKSFGKYFGAILIILFAINIFITLIESASFQADSMHQNMMVETPNWYFLLFFVIPALYIVRKDLVAVIIIIVIGVSLITIAGIHLGLLTIQQKSFSGLFPIFSQGLNGYFFTSILKCLGLYGFMSLTFPYIPYITYKRESLLKATKIGLIIIIQMQIIAITGIFMTFSSQDAVSYYYPKLIQTHLVSYFAMLEFGELYVMLQTLGGFLMKYLIAFHALLQIMKGFNLKSRVLYISSFVITGLVFIISIYLTNTSLRLFKALDYLPWINLFNFVLIPTIAFIIYRCRLVGKAQPEN